MPRFTTLVKKVACGTSSCKRWGMFSWPSGINVSSSRQPPPNVTTTTLRLRLGGAAQADFEKKPNDAPPAVAPVTSDKNSLRLRETDSVTSRGFEKSGLTIRGSERRLLSRDDIRKLYLLDQGHLTPQVFQCTPVRT